MISTSISIGFEKGANVEVKTDLLDYLTLVQRVTGSKPPLGLSQIGRTESARSMEFLAKGITRCGLIERWHYSISLPMQWALCAH